MNHVEQNEDEDDIEQIVVGEAVEEAADEPMVNSVIDGIDVAGQFILRAVKRRDDVLDDGVLVADDGPDRASGLECPVEGAEEAFPEGCAIRLGVLIERRLVVTVENGVGEHREIVPGK